MFVGGRCLLAEEGKVTQVATTGDLTEHRFVDVFDRELDRRMVVAIRELAVGADRSCGDNGGSAEEVLQQDGTAARLAEILIGKKRNDALGQRAQPAAQQGKCRGKIAMYVGRS